jgi:hypothetical protein
VKDLVQCAVPTGSNQQIHFVCFRRKSPRVSHFPSHSHFDAMSGCSLPSNCGAEDVIPGNFSVENQANPFASCFAFHRDGRGGLKKCSSLHDESASARIKNGRLFPIAAKLHLYCIAMPIAEIDL